MCSKAFIGAPLNTEKHNIESEEMVNVFEGFSKA